MLGIDFAAAPPSRPGQKAEQVPETRGGTLPAETGPLFAKAVSISGGCYLGQEVVARMHARKVVARRIVGIRMQEDALPSAGVEVDVDDQPVGLVSSSTLSPVLSGACLALAMIKRPHFEPGTEVQVPAEGRRVRGMVQELPFLR
jgi:folate-binding protein YgfZ